MYNLNEMLDGKLGSALQDKSKTRNEAIGDIYEEVKMSLVEWFVDRTRECANESMSMTEDMKNIFKYLK
jgi:hypothetical protein